VTLAAACAGTQAEVSVSDTGPGIPAADLPHLFDRFYQARTNVAPATGEGGRGLGLAIVKRITELHGGEVEVQSPAEINTSGTRVTLRIPLLRDSAAL
jgi:signal transduction histidine kinase